MSEFDWAITQKKTETMEGLQNRRFKVWSGSPFAIGERRTTFVNMQNMSGTWELFALTPTLIYLFFNGNFFFIESRLSTLNAN
jgi:hypothetical protein